MRGLAVFLFERVDSKLQHGNRPFSYSEKNLKQTIFCYVLQTFVQTSDFTVRALLNSSSLNRHNF